MSSRRFIFGLDDDGEYGEEVVAAERMRRNSVGQQKDILRPTPSFFSPRNTSITREVSDQRGGNSVVAREAFRMFRRQVGDGQRERTETVETNDTQLIVDGHEDTRHVAFLVLGLRADGTNRIQSRNATGERPSSMFAKCSRRMDDHGRSTDEAAMALESFDETRSWLGVTVDRRDKGVAIRVQENHAFMLIKEPARAFVSEIASSKPSDGHGLVDHLLLPRAPGRNSRRCALEFPLLRRWVLSASASASCVRKA